MREGEEGEEGERGERGRWLVPSLWLGSNNLRLCLWYNHLRLSLLIFIPRLSLGTRGQGDKGKGTAQPNVIYFQRTNVLDIKLWLPELLSMLMHRE
jgi:hypothetical protein